MIAPLDLLAAANEIGVRAYCSKLAEQNWLDVGACGYATMTVPANTIFAQALIAAGKGLRCGRGLTLSVEHPPGIRRVQTWTVNFTANRAMADHLIANGVEDVEFNDWVD